MPLRHPPASGPQHEPSLAWKPPEPSARGGGGGRGRSAQGRQPTGLMTKFDPGRQRPRPHAPGHTSFPDPHRPTHSLPKCPPTPTPAWSRLDLTIPIMLIPYSVRLRALPLHPPGPEGASEPAPSGAALRGIPRSFTSASSSAAPGQGCGRSTFPPSRLQLPCSACFFCWDTWLCLPEGPACILRPRAPTLRLQSLSLAGPRPRLLGRGF